MCFHEADKLNSGTESKTFLKLETPNLKLNTLTASRGSLHRHSNSRRLSNSSIQRTDTKDSDSMGVVNNEGVVGEDLHRDSSHSNKVHKLYINSDTCEDNKKICPQHMQIYACNILFTR